MTIRDRNLPGGWHIALIEDGDRNRYIEAFDAKGNMVLSMSPSHKLYQLFNEVLAQPPMIQDEELLKLYETSTHNISHKYGRVLAYARAVIEVTRRSWGVMA